MGEFPPVKWVSGKFPVKIRGGQIVKKKFGKNLVGIMECIIFVKNKSIWQNQNLSLLRVSLLK